MDPRDLLFGMLMQRFQPGDQAKPALPGAEPAGEELARIQRALDLLGEDERPTMQIRMVDPDPAKMPIFRVRPNTAMIFQPEERAIYLNRKSPEFLADPEQLAAALAHEQHHVANGPDEAAAYQRQLDVLLRAGYEKKNRPYVDAMRKRVQQRSKKAN